MATCPSCRDHFSDDVTSCPKDGATLVPDAIMAAADTDLPAGEMVGEYRIEEKVGAGGFGAVYRAVHPLIGKTAAVKVLHRQFSSNPQMVSRFIAEAKSVNQIRHKNIIDIFSFGALPDGRQYYVMELLEGTSFDRHIKQRGRLPVDEALPILRQVARALDAAHAAGIVHRDLKPENIFLLFDEDGVPTPKLLDFGIAKLLGDSEQSHKTRTGTPMGTPYYMSPEQARGRSVDHRTDIYSFGVMTHEVLTGRVVFDGESVMDVLLKHVNTPPPRVSEACPELPSALDEPVQRMLAKDPAARPATLAEAVDSLARAAAGAGFSVPVPARGGPQGIPSARTSDRGIVVTPSGAATQPSADLAEAQTVIGGHPSLMGSTADIPPNRRTRTLLLGALVVAVAAAAAAAGFLASGGGGDPTAQTVATEPSTSASARPTVTPSGAPTTPALPARTAAPAATPGVTPTVTPAESVSAAPSSAPAAASASAAPSRSAAPSASVGAAAPSASAAASTAAPGSSHAGTATAPKPTTTATTKPTSDVQW